MVLSIDLLSLHWVDEDKLRDPLVGVPCLVAIYRYVQWHNQASTMVHEMVTPSQLIYYNDYQD